MIEINGVYRDARMISANQMSKFEQEQLIRRIEKQLLKEDILIEWEVKDDN